MEYQRREPVRVVSKNHKTQTGSSQRWLLTATRRHTDLPDESVDLVITDPPYAGLWSVRRVPAEVLVVLLDRGHVIGGGLLDLLEIELLVPAADQAGRLVRVG